MRVRLTACLVVAGIAALPASAVAKNRITMKPSMGGARTHFAIGFTAPQKTTGQIGTLRRYEINARGPARHGCQSFAFTTLGAKRNGARVSAKLIPTGSSSWCAGTFHGRIVETMRPVCGPAKACPQYIAVVRTIGKFTFHVKASGTNNGPIVAPSPPLPPVQPPCEPLKRADLICG
jgi:hypothetical protein